MKKAINAIVALGAALAFAVAGAVGATTALADDNYTITIHQEANGHTYEAYQIFTGMLGTDADGHDVLGDLDWGNGVNASAVVSALNSADPAPQTPYTDAKSVANAMNETDKWTFAKIFSQNLTSTEYTSTQNAADGTYTITVPKAGYYLIKDQNGTMNDVMDDAGTAAILEVVKDVPVWPKSSVPAVIKEVQDEPGDAASGADNEGYGSSADHAINETFNFKLVASLPQDNSRGQYDSYTVTFNDTMSDGITFGKIESVSINGVAVPEDAYVCTAKPGLAGGSWTLTIDNVLPLIGDGGTRGADIEVIYSASLNADAQISQKDSTIGNTNTVNLTYSNSPTDGSSVGKTPNQTVYVATYRVRMQKVNEKGDALPGAEFNLEDSDGNAINFSYNDKLGGYVPDTNGSPTLTSGSDGFVMFFGLDAGNYKLIETKAPAGYNTIDPEPIPLTPTHDGDTVKTGGTGSTMNLKLVDKAGSVLPSTGGIGTTLFYVVGGIVIVAAAIGIGFALKRRNH